MLEAVIFDMDGVLADTEPLHFEAYRRTFEAHGVSFTKYDHNKFWVAGGGGLDSFLKANDSIKLLRTDIYFEKSRFFTELVRSQNVRVDSTCSLVLQLKEKFKLALCTNSSQSAMAEILKNIGLSGAFSVILTKDDVATGKPSPDIFLKASKLMCVNPENCIVIEDARKGIVAALKANMPVIIYNIKLDQFTSVRRDLQIPCAMVNEDSIMEIHKGASA